MEQHLLTAQLFWRAQRFLGGVGFWVEQRFWRAQRFLGGVGFGWSSALALHRLCILSQAALAAEG